MDMIFRQARHMSTAQGNRPATRSLQQLPAEERPRRRRFQQQTKMSFIRNMFLHRRTAR